MTQSKSTESERHLDEWVNATLNIHSELSDDQKRSRVWEIVHDADSKYTNEEKDKALNWVNNTPKPRMSGTALFVENEGRHYLVSARHVFEDTTQFHKNQLSRSLMLVRNANTPETITNIRPFVNGGLIIEDSVVASLNAYGYGYDTCTLTFLFAKNYDLAVIFLDARDDGKDFVHTLYSRGYKPIAASRIRKQNVDDNQQVTAIGFPSNISDYSYIQYPEAVQKFRPANTSIPIVSRGKIVNPNYTEYDFETELFTFGGNSGGPVISGRELVGLVSRIEWEDKPNASGKLLYRVGHWLNVKASLILPMIQKLEAWNQFPFESNEFFD